MNSVLFWNDVALAANATDHSVVENEQGGPTFSSRALAIVHAAIYDAVNSLDKTPGQPYRFHIKVSGKASGDYAVCGAALTALRALYPSQQAMFDAKYVEFKGAFPAGAPDVQAAGFSLGSEIAQLLLGERENDGSDKNRSPRPSPLAFPNSHCDGMYEPGRLPGMHNLDPLHPAQGFHAPQWGRVVPFVVGDITSYRAPAPPDLHSTKYLNSYDSVRLKGRFRTFPLVTPTVPNSDRPDQKMLDLSGDAEAQIGIFWAYDGANKIGTPPRLYNQVARQIALDLAFNLQDSALFFAVFNLAMADAGVASWDAKYFYNFWRPVLGIRNHPGPQRDRNWKPLGSPRSNTTAGDDFTPPFPAYTSGHATFGAASLTAMKAFLQFKSQPTNQKFTILSDELNGKTTDSCDNLRPALPRTFDLDTAIQENLWSRVYLGVHWDFDGIEGVKIGERIGNDVATAFGLPVVPPLPTTVFDEP